MRNRQDNAIRREYNHRAKWKWATGKTQVFRLTADGKSIDCVPIGVGV